MREALGRIRLAAYSAPSFVTSLAALPFTLFVPAYYADELAVPLASVGLAIGASRLFDVVTDPLIGRSSDRFHPAVFRGARRKPWMLLGAPLLMLAAWQLLVPPAGADAFLPKPMDVSVLLETIAMLLQRHWQRRETDPASGSRPVKDRHGVRDTAA